MYIVWFNMGGNIDRYVLLESAYFTDQSNIHWFFNVVWKMIGNIYYSTDRFETFMSICIVRQYGWANIVPICIACPIRLVVVYRYVSFVNTARGQAVDTYWNQQQYYFSMYCPSTRLGRTSSDTYWCTDTSGAWASWSATLRRWRKAGYINSLATTRHPCSSCIVRIKRCVQTKAC